MLKDYEMIVIFPKMPIHPNDTNIFETMLSQNIFNALIW